MFNFSLLRLSTATATTAATVAAERSLKGTPDRID